MCVYIKRYNANLKLHQENATNYSFHPLTWCISEDLIISLLIDFFLQKKPIHNLYFFDYSTYDR